MQKYDEIKAEMQALLRQADFSAQLAKANTLSALGSLFRQNGVDLTDEELDAFVSYGKQREESGELDAAALELASGGIAGETAAARQLRWCIIGMRLFRLI